MLWSAFLLLFLLLSSPAVGSHLDDQMKDMADDIGTSLRSISSAHNHKVDWLFVVDHGGFTNDNMRLQYSNFFVQQLATNLYISPMNSQAGVLTYGATTNLQIPLDVSDGNQCEFNKMVNKLVLTAGQSDMNQALHDGIKELTNNGRDSAHQVMILVTSASWENVGTNPYENVAKAKNIGTLIVIVLVFDRSQSLVAPVILGFASERKVPSKVVGRPSIEQRKYAFEIEAKRENLRRLYRHFLLFAEQMPYRSLQVSNRHCSACSMRDACTCDVHLYNTYHCDADTYEPLITVGCPSDITSDTESGLSTATIIWLSAQAIDYSTYMSKHVILETNGFTNVTNNVRDVNSTHKSNTFPIGVSKVTQRFVDGSGNAVNCSFKVTVVDNEVPKIFNCPSATIYDNTTSLMATKRIYWPEVTSTDNSGVKPTSKLYINNILKANGDQYFGIGYSTVRIEFIDQSKNFASCRFDVVVKDYSPPTVQQCYGTNNSVILSDDTQAYVDWVEPMFIDNSGLSVNISSDKQPGYFRKGSHTVTYTATDAFGNSNSCSFNFTVKGYPCKAIRAPLNGALVCDNIADGASCQIFCQNPYEFESLSDVIALPETYLCKGKGTWYPTNKVPNCVEHQGIFKRLPKTYYYDGDCKDPAVSEDLRKNAAKHYRGFVEGQYFKEAYFREANATDFRMPECGGGPLQPTRKVVIIPPTGPGGPVSKPRPTPSTINPKTNGANAVAG